MQLSYSLLLAIGFALHILLLLQQRFISQTFRDHNRVTQDTVLPPSIHGSSKRNGGTNRGHHSNDAKNSTLFVASSLDIETCIRISGQIETVSERKEDAIHRTGNGILEASQQGGDGEGSNQFEAVLMASLDTIEGISLLVIAGSCVEIRIQHVELFASFHDSSTHPKAIYEERSKRRTQD